MSDIPTDPELQAMQQVIKALESLEAPARTRVLSYVFQRLGLDAPASTPPADTSIPAPQPTAAPRLPAASLLDIRSLREAKQPKSDSQMAALTAYYLKHHAPPDERKDTITTADIEKYFVQAGYPLPKQPRFTLLNAKNGGYFDPAGTGVFKLNPVGHNLVAHGMTSSSQSGSARSPKAKKSK